MVISEGQERVTEALAQKTKKAIELYTNLVTSANQEVIFNTKEFSKEINLPRFIK